jgi:hypothetical protein
MGEIVEYGKVTLEALGRLKTRYQQPYSHAHDTMNDLHSLSSIASQLSEIRSLLSVRSDTNSSSVAPSFNRPPPAIKEGSSSPLSHVNPGYPPMRTKRRRNSHSLSPSRTGRSIFQSGWYDPSISLSTYRNDLQANETLR